MALYNRQEVKTAKFVLSSVRFPFLNGTDKREISTINCVSKSLQFNKKDSILCVHPYFTELA